ncbi:7755_t:CDS:2, partial [Racocetra fulgida]
MPNTEVSENPVVLDSSKKRKLSVADTVSTIPTADSSKLRVKRLSEKAKLPYRVSPQAAALINTDISIALPEGTYGRVAPRSGLVIDADFRGPVGVLLFNFSDEDYK